jgi:hypothetical protein
VDLKLAAITRAGIHLADGQAAVERLSYPFFQLSADDGDFSFDPGRKRLGDNTGAEYLVEDT